MSIAENTRRLRRRRSLPPLAVALLLACVPAVRADDGDPTAAPVKPPSMKKLADEIDRHEGAILSAEAEIVVIQKGRLADALKAITAARGAVADAEKQLHDLTAGVKKRIADKCNREYNDRKRRYDDALRALKNTRDNDLRRLNAEDDSYKRERRRIRNDYDRNRKREQDSYKRGVRDIKRRFEKEVAGELKKNAGKVKELQANIRSAKADVLKQTRGRSNIYREISAQRSTISSHRKELIVLRRQVSERTEEAWQAGLRPRNGRYRLNEETGEITIVGGLWGRPRPTDEWKRSNHMQASELLNLAEKMKKVGKIDLWRKCLLRLIQDLPDSTDARKARELLDAAAR